MRLAGYFTIGVVLLWTYNHSHPLELYHYGIPGMKWGVRRTKEQLGYDRAARELIRSGDILTKVNKEKQARHLKGHKDYVEGRSIFDGNLDDAQKLIDELSGTGRPIVSASGAWQQKELVRSPHIVGTDINKDTGKRTRTNMAMIQYSKTGTHIYPNLPKEKD